MDEKNDKPGGRRFGWLAISGLTILWLLGATLWLRSLTRPDGFYQRVSQLSPGALPFLGWTLTFTLIVLWGGLLWARYRAANTSLPQLTQAELLELEPGQFEQYVALVFRHKGYRVEHLGRTGDHGVDLKVYPSVGRLGVVQCKRYRSTVGEQVVRDLYGTMVHEGAAHAFLVTAGEISAAARTWAQEKPITLVNGKQLIQAVRAVPGRNR